MEEKKKLYFQTILLIIFAIIILLGGIYIYRINSKQNEDIKPNETNEIQTLFENFLKIDTSAYKGTVLELLNIGYDKNKDVDYEDNIITNVKYDDYKNAMLNYVSESFFEKEYTKNIGISKNKNGMLIKSQGGGDYPDIEILKVSKTKDLSYEVEIKTSYSYNDETSNETYKFTLKEYNGKLVVDTFSERQ